MFYLYLTFLYFSGNPASTTQGANTVYLKDLAGPLVKTITPKADNTAIIVTFDEEVFTNSDGTGGLDTPDVTLTLAGGNAVLKDPKPTSFAKSGNTYTLGIDLEGKVNGFGIGRITAVTHSPVLGHWIGLGFIKGGESKWKNKEVIGSDPVRNNEVRIQIVSPHIYDPEGKKMHG